ncbi:MAG: DnaJ domain-containing protein [Cyanobacteria bacterium P01_H01_bin.15]
MAAKIKYGLFKYDIEDHYAILGVPLGTDFKSLRLRYLKVASKLHPDTCKAKSAQEKQLAGAILSRLVNPAYEFLSREKNRRELNTLITQIGRKLLAEKAGQITLGSDIAKELASAGNNLDRVYRQLQESLAAQQYQDFSTLEASHGKIAQLSELNLVYLLLRTRQQDSRKKQERLQAALAGESSSPLSEPLATPTSSRQTNASKKAASVSRSNSSGLRPSNTAPQSPGSSANPPAAETPATSAEPQTASYLRRARNYLNARHPERAVLELRDALKLDPNDAACHALMGLAYLRQKQISMAKVHINKATSASPKDPVVLEAKQALNELLDTKANASGKSTKKSAKNDKNAGRTGLFSGIFGGKKK